MALKLAEDSLLTLPLGRMLKYFPTVLESLGIQKDITAFFTA
jgi:hypothetical protein